MTEEQLREIEERVSQALPGPWVTEEEQGYAFKGEYVVVSAAHEEARCPAPKEVRCAICDRGVASTYHRPTSMMIARSREDLLALVAEVRRLRAALTEAAALEREACAQAVEEVACGHCTRGGPLPAEVIRARGGK